MFHFEKIVTHYDRALFSFGLIQAILGGAIVIFSWGEFSLIRSAYWHLAYLMVFIALSLFARKIAFGKRVQIGYLILFVPLLTSPIALTHLSVDALIAASQGTQKLMALLTLLGLLLLFGVLLHTKSTLTEVGQLRNSSDLTCLDPSSLEWRVECDEVQNNKNKGTASTSLSWIGTIIGVSLLNVFTAEVVAVIIAAIVFLYGYLVLMSLVPPLVSKIIYFGVLERKIGLQLRFPKPTNLMNRNSTAIRPRGSGDR